MARLIKLITLFFFFFFFFLCSLTASASIIPTSFILNSCKPTSYPSVCIQSLSTYAPAIRRSPRLLAHAALTLSFTHARDTSTYVSRLSSGSGQNSVHPQTTANAYQDCVATMTDSANRLQQSIHEFGRLGRAGRRTFALRLSNVQTWVSAALTDQSMCLLSLSEGGSSQDSQYDETNKKVMEVSKITSNALALVNRLGSRN